MSVSRLMSILIDAENRLGWVPKGRNLPLARAGAHRMLSRAMSKRGYTEDDVEFALAYCVRKHVHIETPLALLEFVDSARELAVERDDNPISAQIREAIAWESGRDDSQSDYWIGRLTRSFGPHRTTTLTEWRTVRKDEN